MTETHVLTGAFGYTGRYLTKRLIARGIEVRTLTNHPGDPCLFSAPVGVHPLDFSRSLDLAASLRGARVLYNTYWVRFDHGRTTYASAVENTKVLFDAARDAGVERVVHVSITNPSPGSPLPYFSGKADLEAHLLSSGLSHAIVRPTVLFGKEDILINNIAYLLRRLPLFGVPGDGRYAIQPVFVDDLAALMADLGSRPDDLVVDAVGPETYAYLDLVRLVRDAIGVSTPIIRAPGWLVVLAGRILGRLVGDVVITSDEVRGLSSGLLVSHDEPTCRTSFKGWVEAHRDTLGTRYANELTRHYT
ncbi:MAG: NAD(P)H-binding protein [Deltaproteobacteria bacterium]|nr:NAD(P)H-binding protein [Deltaproteobacteria bacterium]